MPSPPLKLYLPARSNAAPLYLGALFLLFTLHPFAQPLVSRESWLVFQQDDFFYYLQVARNLAAGHGSTANGLVLTNGYHPLWLLLLTAACRVSTSGPWLAFVLAVTGFLASASTLLLSLHLLRRLARLPILSALPLAFAVTVYSLKLFFDGMEITLTIPLALAACALFLHRFRPTPAVAIKPHPTQGLLQYLAADLALGLLLSLTVLSRLDSALFLALLTVGVLLTPALRRQLTPARLLAFALGLSPIAVNLALNQHLFGTLLPISGVAKQLRTSHLPSAAVWESVTGPHPLSALKLLIPLAALALLSLDLHRNRAAATQLSPAATTPLAALGLFPLIHLLVLSLLSDWRLWPWYLYTFRLALLATLILLARLPAVRSLLARPNVAIALAALGLVAALASRRDTTQTTAILHIADDLTHFAHTHPPGIYAMGDRSGLVAYLLPDPVVQTEGLTMDPAFVSLIRSQTPLLTVLHRYNVRYFVATVYLPPHTPIPTCLPVAEPFQAGPSSPHMRATFCARPVARFLNGEFPTLVYDLAHP